MNIDRFIATVVKNRDRLSATVICYCRLFEPSTMRVLVQTALGTSFELVAAPEDNVFLLKCKILHKLGMSTLNSKYSPCLDSFYPSCFFS